MKSIYSYPLDTRAQILYEELLALVKEDKIYLEQELNMIEAWENFSRQQALELLWSYREAFSDYHSKKHSNLKVI